MKKPPKNIEDLIPKDKGDFDAAEDLKNYSIRDLTPIIPKLLEWLQDMNWPIAGIVAEYLRNNFLEIEMEIYPILKSNDEIWKWYIINNFQNEINDGQIISEIKRLAQTPTKLEIEEELHFLSKEVINKRNW